MNLSQTPLHFFTENASRYPRKYCISSIASDLTYKDANERSTQLAECITNNMPVTGNSVAVVVEDFTLVSLLVLASLKTDATFVFIDSKINPEAINTIFKENIVALLVTEKKLYPSFDKVISQTLFIDEFDFDGCHNSTATGIKTGSSFKVYTTQENEFGYVEYEIESGVLTKTFDSLDKLLSSFSNDKLCFAGSIALQEFIVEALHAFTRGKHIVISSLLPKQYFENDEQFSMDFSLFYFGSYSNKIDNRDKYSLLIESVKHGDKNGYSAVWTPERHFNEFGGLFPNPSVLGSALAMITSNVQVRAGSIVSPLHHSVRIAEDWAIIDNLSNGRAALSFASGWQCDDFVFYPERYEKRHQQMLDQIEEVQNLWKGGSIELKNGLGKNINIEVFPKPIQPALPIWVTVSGKTETFIDAGKIGANILTHLLWQDSSELKEKIAAYRTSLKQHGFDPASGIVSVMLHTYVGENDEAVRKIVREPLKAYIKSSVHLIEAMTKSNDVSQKETVGRYGNVNDKIPERLLEELVEIAFNRFFEEAALLGSPEKCHRLLRKLRDYDVNELACLIDFGLDQETILEGLKHLSELKANYDFKITKKYRPSLLRTSTESLEELTADSSFRPSLQSVRKIVMTSSFDHTKASRLSNLLELKYDFSTGQPVVEQVGGSENEGRSMRDLSHVNSVIDENF